MRRYRDCRSNTCRASRSSWCSSTFPAARDPLAQPCAHYGWSELTGAVERRAPARQLERTLEEALPQARSRDGAVAQSEAQRLAFWRLRETIPEAQTRAGGSLKHDMSVPVSAVATLLEQGIAAALAIAPQARVCAYGHVGDGNLHFNFQAPAGQSLQAFVDTHGAAISEGLVRARRRARGQRVRRARRRTAQAYAARALRRSGCARPDAHAETRTRPARSDEPGQGVVTGAAAAALAGGIAPFTSL